MVKVVITGGSGFVAAHLIKRLQETASGVVTEIQTIDRRPGLVSLFPGVPSTIPIRHHCFDLVKSDLLEQVLQGADVVFHLARKQFDPLIGCDLEQYRKDNLEATKQVLSAIVKCEVGSLIYLGDAYANMPGRDNFGNSEDIHGGEPSSYMLGYYGETKNKAELFARSKVGSKFANGKQLNAIFFRPTMIYGEGSCNLIKKLKKVAEANEGCLPYIQGNLALLMEEAMLTLLSTPEDINGEFFYCMDKTEATLFSTFLAPFNLGVGPARTLISYYLETLWAEIKAKFSAAPPKVPTLSMGAIRMYFIYALGFTNRKQQLMFKARFETCQSELLDRTVQWIKQNLTVPTKSMESKMSVFRRG